MPRNHNAGPSTLRNRNRVTNKTRLKVITETIDADPIVLEEDEEKIRVVSTAGVDAEDANEHHLQAVLSAAATRHQAGARSTRAASEKEKAEPTAYIPTPDSTGVVANYEDLYSSGRWKDPVTYVKFSDTVEESISSALAGGFIYYMDERDKEWLDKNNEEARGEGTSAQGAVSGTSTRSGRSSKSKGKDPEVIQPVVLSEDEFELVMAVFEKVTHEKTEFLHHGLEQGTPFPPFSDYQDTFASHLSPSLFALFSVPRWVPEPHHLVKLARVVYPYWRERRLERAGHPIIPIVNLDETDTKNESYICFRRREIKAVRKTRAQQATYSDKILRLKAELATSMDLASGVLQREKFKREAARQAQTVWGKRFMLVDFKRKYPSLCGKEDDDLFYDKERAPKKPKADSTGRIPIKIRTPRDNGELGSPVAHAEPPIRPKERLAQIQNQIEEELAKRKEKDHHWEDAIDNAYQPLPTPYASKLFKVIAASRRPSSSAISPEPEQPILAARACRLRYGRGGRLHLDRRIVLPQKPSSPDIFAGVDPHDVEAQEQARRIAERWRYDTDDVPAVGPEGPDEKDRMLLDDYQPKYLVHHMTLLNEQDYQMLSTDASITTISSDGRPQTHVPFKLGSHSMYRRDIPAISRPGPSPIVSGQPISAMQSSSSSLSMSSNSTPVAVATQLKKMAPPTNLPHMRISSNGGMRPPGLPSVPMMQHNMQASLSSPHSTPPIAVGQINGMSDATGQASDGGEQSAKPSLHPSPNGHLQEISDQSRAEAGSPSVSSASPRSKAQLQQSVSIPAVPNGYHITPINSYSTPVANAQYIHATARPNTLTPQQMQTIKSVYPPTPSLDSLHSHNASMQLRPQQSYIVPNAGNYSPQFHGQRHMQQYLTQQQQQRPPSISVTETTGVDGLATPALSPPLSSAPARTPSANGMRTAISRGVVVPTVPNVSHSLGQSQGRASPATISRLPGSMSPSSQLLTASMGGVQHQGSPTRSPQPPMALPSPSVQSRHVVGSSGAGY